MALAVLLPALLAGCVQPDQNGQQDAPRTGSLENAPPRITPDGYGPVRVHMSPQDAAEALGAELLPLGPGGDTEACRVLTLSGQSEGLHFMVQDDQIVRISDYDAPDALTAQGVGAGSSDEQIRRAYPDATEQPAKYEPPPAHDLIVWAEPGRSGLRFEVNAEGIATALHAGDESIQLVEGCG